MGGNRQAPATLGHQCSTLPSYATGRRISAETAEAFLAGHRVSPREIEQVIRQGVLFRLDADGLKRAVASELWLRNRL